MADPYYTFGTSWQFLSIAIAFTSVIVSIIFLMLSRLFANPKLEQTAKSEIVFAASTVLLVMFVLSVLPAAEEISVEYVQTTFYEDPIQQAALENTLIEEGLIEPGAGWSGTGGITVIDITIAYLNTALGCAVIFMNALWVIDIFVQAVLSIVMEVMMSELATGFFMNLFSERITKFTQILTFYMIIFHLIFNILVFLKYFGMSFFTLGVLMRAFPPTRGAGAFLMALCVGLYFIFPLSYIVIAATYSEGSTDAIFCDITGLPEVDTTTAGSFDIKKVVFEHSLKLKAYEGEFSQILTRVQGYTQTLGTLLFCLPMFAFMITLSFILSASSFFGATVPEVGKGLIKLL